MADKLTPLVSNLIGRGLDMYASRKRRQAMKEARKEMMEAQAHAVRSIDPSKVSGGKRSRDQPPRSPERDTRGIDRLQQETDCTFCEALLETMGHLDEPERSKAIAEYGRFQGELEGGDEDAIKTAMRESEVLSQLVREMREVPSEP